MSQTDSAVRDDLSAMKPLRCLLGRHTGQAEGGTMMFTCPRCHDSYWQKHDYSAVTRAADEMIAAGHHEEALAFARDAVKRGLHGP